MADTSSSRRVPYFGDFVLFEELGRGGMGVVYSAQQTTLDRPVALKVLHSQFATKEGGVQRLRIEAEATARLDHPNIVRVLEFGEHDGHPYLATQLIRGDSLAHHIARSGADLSGRDSAALVAKIARAVHHAHQRGVLHRDLKPGNIILDETGEPHVIDFGLAKCLERSSDMTRTGAFLGTPAFSSPEQAAGQTKLITTASDLYSLGAILYALLTGRPPFSGESQAEITEQVRKNAPPAPRSINPTVPKDVETICLKCLEKEASRRYGSALQMAEDLDRFLGGAPISARPVGPLERAWMWTRRHPVDAALGVTGVLVLVASLAGFAFWRSAQSLARENESLLELGARISASRTRYPRDMSWSRNIRESLAPQHVATQRSYYRDQVAATLEGLDATVLAQRSVTGNEQVSFEQSRDELFFAGPGHTSLWQLDSGDVSEVQTAAPNVGTPIAFPGHSPLQVVKTSSGRLAVWQLARRELVCELDAPSSLYSASSFEDLDSVVSASSSDRSRVALVLKSGELTNALVVWQLPTGRLINSVEVDTTITSLALSPNGALGAYGNSSGQIGILDLSTGQTLQELSLSSLSISSLAFSESVRRKANQAGDTPGWVLAAGDIGGTIGIWNLDDRRPQAVCRGGYYQVYVLAFSPDNMTLASGGRGPVRLWDVATGTPLLDLGGDYCGALSFNNDGSRLAASTDHHRPTQKVQVWQLENGRGVAALRGLSSSVNKVVFSPNGNRLAAVGVAWEVGVWDAQAGKLLHVIQTPVGFTSDNFALAFNADGSRLALSTGNEAQLWDVLTGTHLRSWPLKPGLVDMISFPQDDSLFLLRMETLQGTEMPLSNKPWVEFPRVCRLRNLLSANPQQPIQEVKDFNVGVFTASVSGDGAYFAIEGINSKGDERTRGILALNAFTGETVWQTVSTSKATSATTPFSSRGALLAFTTDGKEYRMRDLLAPAAHFAPFPVVPVAIGPDHNVWASRGQGAGATGGIGYYERDKLRANLGLDADSHFWPCFDQAGRWLAWGNADGTVSLCDLPEIRLQLSRSNLDW